MDDRCKKKNKFTMEELIENMMTLVNESEQEKKGNHDEYDEIHENICKIIEGKNSKDVKAALSVILCIICVEEEISKDEFVGNLLTIFNLVKMKDKLEKLLEVTKRKTDE